MGILHYAFVWYIWWAWIVSLACGDGVIKVFKTGASLDSLKIDPVKVIYYNSVVTDEKLKNGKVPRHYDLKDGFIESAFLKYYDSRHCYSKIKQADRTGSNNSKKLWLLLLSADLTSCGIHRKIMSAQNAKYDGLILYGDDSNVILEDKNQLFQYKIPVFIISNEDGEYFKEIFDNKEILHYIRIETTTKTWNYWNTAFDATFSTFKFIIDVIIAFITVIIELILKWVDTAFSIVDKTGIISLIIICLPILILIFAAFIFQPRDEYYDYRFFAYGGAERRNWFDSSSFYGTNEEDYKENYEEQFTGRTEEDTIKEKHCRTLGISTDSSFDQARAAYLDLCKTLHSDRSQGLTRSQTKLNEERLKEVTAAWRELKNYLRPSSSN